MNQELRTMTEEWMQLERQTQAQREKAEVFYDTKLMRLIEQEFIRNNRHKVYEKTEYMILSVGTSYEPLVLNIQLLQPRRLLFLYTPKTEYILEKIVRYCELDVARFSKREVNETDPLDIYREIKAAYLRWNKPDKLYIDFTGGTKSMSAAAAMAGAIIDVQLLYVGSNEYLPHFRKPNPGSERLFFISNPMEVFGDLEIEKAFALFDQFNYAGAREKLATLKESVPTPDIRQQLSFAYLLAQTYEYWDSLEFPKAYETICQLNRQLERDARINRKFLLIDCLPTLRRQEAMLRKLTEMSQLLAQKQKMEVLTNQEYIIPLMFTMYTNAQIRRKQTKYDMATLLLYRLLEMIEQRRLATYNLFVSDMNYQTIHYNLERQPHLAGLSNEEQLRMFRDGVVRIRGELFRKKVSANLADQVSLMDGFVLLLALNDEIVQVPTGKPIGKLRRIQSMVHLRNNSIFAHGLGPVPEQDFEKFQNLVVELFRKFCQVEQVDFEEYVKDMEWINPLHTENYAGMEG